MRMTTRHIYLTTSQFAQYNVGYRSDKLGSVDKSSPEALRPKASPRDPVILNNAKTDCTDKARTGSRGLAAGRRGLNCQQTLLTSIKHLQVIFFYF